MLGRPPGRQPGAHRPDGPGPQAPDVRHRRGRWASRRSRSGSRRPASPTSTSSGSSSRRTSSPTTSPSRCSRSAGPSSSSAPTSACRAPTTRSSTSTTPPRSSSAGWCSASTRTASPQIATDAAKLCQKLEPTLKGTNVRYEYSPESFTGTEIDYAIEICSAVFDVIEPGDERLILNLPATVEMYTPNLYGDVIEYFHRNVPNRDRVLPVAAPAQRPGHRRGGRPARRSWPAPTASRARSSATASAPATSTSSTSP